MIQVSVISKNRVLSVQAATREMSRELQQVKSKIPSITAQAVNFTARWARDDAIQEVAKDIGQKPYYVKNTTKDGDRSNRFNLRRASRNLPIAYVDIRTEGIQFTDIANAAVNPWNKPGIPAPSKRRPGGGVKLKGGRFQPGAWKGRARGKGAVRVWLPRLYESTVNPGKAKLSLPRIGVRERFQKYFTKTIEGSKGQAVYAAKFTELGDRALEKAGFK